MESADRLTSGICTARRHTGKIFDNRLWPLKITSLADKILHGRVKIFRCLPRLVVSAHKVGHLVRAVPPLVKGHRRRHKHTVLHRADAVQQRCHMPVIPQIVRAPAIDRYGCGRRESYLHVACIGNLHIHDLHRIVQRNKRRDLCRKLILPGGSRHGLPHKTGCHFVFIRKIRKFFCDFFRRIARGGPASVRSDMAPEISGIPIIMKILHAHRLQQKRILIQLAVPAKCRRHRAFDTTLPCDREIQITVICRPRQRKNSLITDKLICILHPASFLSFFYYSKEKNRHKKRYLFFERYLFFRIPDRPEKSHAAVFLFFCGSPRPDRVRSYR